MKCYLNVPPSDTIFYSEELNNSFQFENLLLEANQHGIGSQEHFKATMMSILLKKNKLFFDSEEISEVLRAGIEAFKEDDLDIDAHRILLDLINEGYIVPVKEVEI